MPKRESGKRETGSKGVTIPGPKPWATGPGKISNIEHSQNQFERVLTQKQRSTGR